MSEDQDWTRILAKVGRAATVSAAGALAREAARALLPPVPKKGAAKKKASKGKAEAAKKEDPCDG